MSSEAVRAAKRRYYYRNRARVLAQQKEYRRQKREEAAFRARLAANTARWRERFKERMRTWNYPGRTGEGLSPEGWRYRHAKGLPVPEWPTLIDASKQRRRFTQVMRVAAEPGRIVDLWMPPRHPDRVARPGRSPRQPPAAQSVPQSRAQETL